MTRQRKRELSNVAESSNLPLPGRRMRTLGPRELEVLKLAAAGLSTRQMAIKLEVSAGTVGAHLHNIFRKLAVKNRRAMVAVAVHRGILRLK